MTIRFDHVGACQAEATFIVEGYSPRDGHAHGSIDVVQRACDDCHLVVRSQMEECGLTPYSALLVTDRRCGDRTVYGENKYTDTYQ